MGKKNNTFEDGDVDESGGFLLLPFTVRNLYLIGMEETVREEWREEEQPQQQDVLVLVQVRGNREIGDGDDDDEATVAFMEAARPEPLFHHEILLVFPRFLDGVRFRLHLLFF